MGLRSQSLLIVAADILGCKELTLFTGTAPMMKNSALARVQSCERPPSASDSGFSTVTLYTKRYPAMSQKCLFVFRYLLA